MNKGQEERCRVCLFPMMYDISSSYESAAWEIEFKQAMLLLY